MHFLKKTGICFTVLVAAALFVLGLQWMQPQLLQPPRQHDSVIGIVWTSTEDQRKDAQINALLNAASDSGFDVLPMPVERAQDAQIQAIRALLVYQVDIIVFTPVVESGWEHVQREAQAAQAYLLQDVRTQLRQMQARSSGEQSRYLNAALRATETIQTYNDQLRRQLARDVAVSVNENLYLEIRSVAQLAATMIDRYVESEISRMGQINASIQRLMVVVIALLAGLIAFSVRSALAASRLAESSIRESILRLEHMAARIAQGDLDARVPPASVDELAFLTRDLNALAGQISRLLSERTLQVQHAKKAELRALQAQITPHFVYNTLETVVWLAEEGRNREVVEITMAFTDFLRISLSSGHDFITVAREEQHVNSYLMIQSVRYGSIMQYEIHIDPTLAEFRMLKLMLQPLVENAIYHGIKGRRGRGYIHVTGRHMGGFMEFCVEDNGLGMPPEKLAALRTSITDPNATGGYGLRNVEQRLRPVL